MSFANNGSEEYDYLQNGIAQILTTTLAKSEQIQIVERNQLEKITNELALGMSGLLDAESAAKVGKVAGANYMVIGSFINLGKAIRLDAKVVETETGIVVPGATAKAKASTVEEIDYAIEGLAKDLLKNLTGEEVKSDIKGDPNQMGKLEFTFSQMGAYNVLVDGKILEPKNFDSMIAVMELSHGKHHIQVERFKNIFKTETEFEENIHIPGGYIVRATYKDKALEVFEIVPIPKSEEIANNDTVSDSADAVSKATSQNWKKEETREDDKSPSRLIFLSEEGMCDIFIDGEKVAAIELPMIDEIGKVEIEDLSPDTYLVKVEGFDVWYDGKLDVGAGEEIKIKVEPDHFEIISRKSIE
jgi:TolB-like protein